MRKGFIYGAVVPYAPQNEFQRNLGKITADEYPRVLFTRRRTADKAKYFGPYTGTATVFSVLSLLTKTLGLPSCNRQFPRDIGKERPCLYYQMGKCCGVCTGKVSPEEYRTLVGYAADILRGNTSRVRAHLEAQMLEDAENERFELAAKARDTIAALDRLSQRQTVLTSPDVEEDVIALYQDEVCACISIFYIREGALTDKSEYLFGADNIIDSSALVSFICENYRLREYIPSRILLAAGMEEEDVATLSEYLSMLAGRKVSVSTPERGEKKRLCELVYRNAEEKAKLYKIDTEKDDGTLLRLAELLGLPSIPERIEAYDVSNIGAEHKTVGMVVCEGGKLKRADYRSFSIREVEGTDDYACMREAIGRRLDHLSDETGSFSRLPDLLLLDGGRGHVAVIRELLAERGVSIPVFGMVKDDFHKTRALCEEESEISIAREQAVFMLIYKIQEEVHRFSITKMRNAKRRTLTTSSLEKIEGIGPKKAKLLLTSFGTLTALRGASQEEIAAIKGISQRDARQIRSYFDNEKKGK